MYTCRIHMWSKSYGADCDTDSYTSHSYMLRELQMYTCRIHMCSKSYGADCDTDSYTSHSYMLRELLKRGTWSIQMCDVTHLCMRNVTHLCRTYSHICKVQPSCFLILISDIQLHKAACMCVCMCVYLIMVYCCPHNRYTNTYTHTQTNTHIRIKSNKHTYWVFCIHIHTLTRTCKLESSRICQKEHIWYWYVRTILC